MTKFLVGIMLLCCPALWANPVWYGNANAARMLYIHSAMDLESFEPLLEAFIALYPQVKVAYQDINTLELYHQTIKEKEAPQASLVISSAMDLQLKLVNDGLAQTYQSETTEALPSMAKWRNQLFAFSYEPIVMLVNKKLFPGPLPQDRQDLLRTIRQNELAMTARIGMYDIRKSGVGYLLVSQDARQADATWGRLLEAFGSHDVQTYCCTRDVIDDVASGKLVLGYNLLGSYASQRASQDSNLEMILPKDYTLMLKRVALIPKKAPNAADAGLFLDFILSEAGQEMMQRRGLLFPIQADVSSLNSPYIIQASGPTRTIELDQQLLVGRDYAKQKRLIQSWESALEISQEN